MSNNIEDEEVMKNLCFKKKRFKFDSPLSGPKSNKKMNSIPNLTIEETKEEIKENHKEHENTQTKEEEVYQKMKRLKKLKDFHDENTCAICLGK